MSIQGQGHSLTLAQGHSDMRGWLGVAKVSCILRHQGVQLMLAYSWARPAVLVADKGRGQIFLSHLLVAGCDIGVRFSVRLSVNIYIDVRHLCQSLYSNQLQD